MPTKTRPSRTGKHHGPEGRTGSKICVSRGRNVPSKISYRKSLLYVSRCRLLGAAAAAADPSKRRLPARKGNPMLLKGDSDCCCCCCANKDTALPDGETHHGPEGRTESKICVSRGRNVPSEISYKKLAIRFSRLAAGSLLAASLLPLRLLLRLLVSAAAY